METRQNIIKIRQSGFTIIEVLIVLAIAGLILLVVFMALPSARRIERNNSRKDFARFAVGQLEQYYAYNNLTYPDTPDLMCNFITGYLQERNKGMGSCTPAYDGAKQCVLVTGGRYDVCYHDQGSPHAYIGNEDELSLQIGHNCNPSQTGNPLIDSSGSHAAKHVAVWTRLEGSRYCVDNYPD